MVEVLLSVYNPNLIFLKKQLESINSQTYKDVKVLIYDDCVKHRCDTDIFDECLTDISWELLPYQNKNLGYVKAFETLVNASEGEYIAFCDQDDIWNPDKINKCVEELKQSHSLIVATERSIIDENDKIVLYRAREAYKRANDSWKSNDDIGKYNLFITYAVGMSMVLDGDFIRRIVPFSIYAGHDNWAILCACAEGTVSFLDEPLVKYRRHSGNVSGVLKGIKSKEDYMRERVLPHAKIVNDFKTLYPENKDICELESFCEARIHHNIRKIYKYRYLSKDVAKFDITVALIPNFLFPLFVKIVQKICN